MALGLSVLPFGRGVDNECFSVEHLKENLVDEYDEEVPIEDQSYPIGDEEFRATGAYYRFAMNTKGGAIFAQNLLKPEALADDNPGGNIIPEKLSQLLRSPDIMWSHWTRINPDPIKLNYYFVNQVCNKETLPPIARIMKSHGLITIPYWPGLELEMARQKSS